MLPRKNHRQLIGWRVVLLFGLLLYGSPAWSIEGGDKKQKAVEVEDVETESKKTAKERKAADFSVEDFVEEKKFEGLKKQDEAIVRLKKLVRSTPKNNPERAEFLFNLAEMYWKKSKYYEQDAFSRQDKCYRYDENSAKRKYKQCMSRVDQSLAESKRLRKEAIDYYEQIVSDYSDFERLDKVYFFLGTNLMETGRQKEAVQTFKRLIAEFPNTKYVPDVLLAFGDYYFRNDQVQQALKAYRKVREYPNSSVYNYARYKEGWCYFNMAQKPKAMQTFLEVIRYARDHPSEQNSDALIDRSQSDLVQTYAHIGRPDKAVGFLRGQVVDDNRSRLIELTEQLAGQYSSQGKPQAAIQIYRKLLELNQDSIATIDYQYQIVQNQLTENIYQEATIESLVRLMNIYKKASPNRFDDYTSEKFEDKKPKVEKISRKWATVFHREAQETKNPKLYEMAAILYDHYLRTFETNDHTYKMTFYHAELQYELENWAKAAKAYDRTSDLKPEGKYKKDAIHGAVIAYFELTNTSEKSADLESKVATEDQQKAHEKKEFSARQKGLIEACKRYIQYLPKGDRIADVKYTLARNYYDAHYFDKATKWFKDIAYNHSDHRLAAVSANLHLDSLNLQDDIDGLHREAQRYLEKRPITKASFLENVRDLSKSIAFKRCKLMEDQQKPKQAAECFEQFHTDFPDSEFVDKALYNAAINYEKVNEIGKAITARLKLLKSSPGTKLAAETLFSIGSNYQSLAVYSKSAKYFELFVDNFSQKEKAKKALANASTFRQGLGQYEKAIQNYEKYLRLYGDSNRQKAGEVSFQIAQIYEQQNKKDKALRQYRRYLDRYGKKGDLNRILQAHVAIGMYYWNHDTDTDRKRAVKWFERTLERYSEASEKQMDDLKAGRDAAARAKFMTGENIYRRVVDIGIDSPNEEVLKKRLRKKTDVAEMAQKTYEKVITYERPGWAIAALYKIGALYENMANTIRNSPVPDRLNDKQTEMYKGILEDRAKKVERKAVSAYKKALQTAKQKSWFNKYSEKAEIRLARLRPEKFRKPSERRAEPIYSHSGLHSVPFTGTRSAQPETMKAQR